MNKLILMLLLVAGFMFADIVQAGIGSSQPIVGYADTVVGVTDTIYSDTINIVGRELTHEMSITWGIDNRDDAATNDAFLWCQYTNDTELGWFHQTVLDSIKDVPANDSLSSSCSWTSLKYDFVQFYEIMTATTGDTIYYRKGTWYRAGK